jgi:hypothetical protein
MSMHLRLPLSDCIEKGEPIGKCGVWSYTESGVWSVELCGKCRFYSLFIKPYKKDCIQKKYAVLKLLFVNIYFAVARAYKSKSAGLPQLLIINC